MVHGEHGGRISNRVQFISPESLRPQRLCGVYPILNLVASTARRYRTSISFMIFSIAGDNRSVCSAVTMCRFTPFSSRLFNSS